MNCYGAAGAGRIWYEILAGFLQESIGLKISQIDRCASLHYKRVGGVRSTCVILVYDKDLIVFGSTSVVSEDSAAHRARFPLTDGASDYLGIEFKI